MNTIDTIDQTAVRALESMMLIRAFEEKSAEIQAAGGPSMCTSVGQEASAVGVIGALQENDLILTNHRSAGHLLARGADPARVMAEILGKRTGYCKGKSGSLHISVKELGVILTSTIVGGELSLVTGAALSLSMSDTDAIAVCFFGDGAAAEGVFHESINLAAVWNLPVLYVCENNQWQAYVDRRETMIGNHIADRARPYGVEAQTVDGNDLVAVADAARHAAAYVRRERKPFLLENYTYRLRGHMEPDDQSYVDRDELAMWQRRDPIAMLSRRLVEGGALTDDDVKAARERVAAAVDQAAAFAMTSPYPDPSELTTDLYA